MELRNIEARNELSHYINWLKNSSHLLYDFILQVYDGNGFLSGELQNQFFMQLNLNNLKIYISFVVIGLRCHYQNNGLLPLTINCIKNVRF